MQTSGTGRRGVLGYLLIAGAGVAVLVLPALHILWGEIVDVESAAGVVTAAVFAASTWAYAVWLWRRGTAPSDVLLAAGWTVGMGLNYGLVIGTVVQQQRYAGVTFVHPDLLINGIVAGGLIAGIVVATFHLRSREKSRELDRINDALEGRNQRLEFLNRLLRHDIRNDVAVIHGYAEELEGTDPNVEPILSKSAHIEELTRIATEVSAAGESTALEPVDLREHVRSAVQSTRDSYPAAEITVADDLAGDVRVLGTELLRSVFVNLLRNAVQHNPGPSPAVEVRLERADDRVRIAVADDGPGVPDAVVESLYHPGVRGDDEGSMGLGLYLVYTLVDSYGGEVSLVRNGDDGATFVVSLPVASTRPAGRSGTAAARGAGERVV